MQGVQEYTKPILKKLFEQNNQSKTKNNVQLDMSSDGTRRLGGKIRYAIPTVKNNEWHINMHKVSAHNLLSIVRYRPKGVPTTFLIDTHNGTSYDIDKLGTEIDEIDAHFKLQNLDSPRDVSTVDDYNCYLYTFELTKAALNYLQKNDTSSLQTACDSKDYDRAKEILHDGMKRYLPMYYDCSKGACIRKPRIDIEKYHRDQRWEISGHVIMDELKKIAQQKQA